jgi:hypothetical protein
MGRLVSGIAAGAVGTTLLDAATYLDMLVRGRPASSVPARSAEALVRRAGRSLGGDDEATARGRKEGLGGLLGVLTGVAGGVAFGLVRPVASRAPWPAAAALCGLGVMAAADASSTALGATDPRSWSATDWVSDLIPHLLYGAGVTLTFDALER